MSLDDRAYIEPRPGQALENIRDPGPLPDEIAAMLDDPPDDDGEHDGRMADAVLVISRLLETLWASGEPGGSARGKRPRRPLPASRLHQAIQRAAMRLCALSWLVCPGAVCRDAITLSDLASCLGVSRAMMSRLHVTWGEFLGGLRGEGGRSDTARAQARISRLRAIESGRGVGLRDGPGPVGDSFEQRDATDLPAARRGLAKLARPHLTDLDRRGQHAQTGHPCNDNLTSVERHALRRRGWLDENDTITPSGIEALAELQEAR